MDITLCLKFLIKGLNQLPTVVTIIEKSLKSLKQLDFKFINDKNSLNKS